MKLILLRHGPAGDRKVFAKTGQDDSLRPLTVEGHKKMKIAARGLRKVCGSVDLLATSPYIRATRTAEIIYAAYNDKPQFVELPLLAGGHLPHPLLEWFRHNDLDAATVLLVGHEPSLSRLAGWLTTGHEKSFVTLKKGAACVIDFPKSLAAGKGVLAGLYQPRDLRRLGAK